MLVIYSSLANATSVHPLSDWLNLKIEMKRLIDSGQWATRSVSHSFNDLLIYLIIQFDFIQIHSSLIGWFCHQWLVNDSDSSHWIDRMSDWLNEWIQIHSPLVTRVWIERHDSVIDFRMRQWVIDSVLVSQNQSHSEWLTRTDRKTRPQRTLTL